MTSHLELVAIAHAGDVYLTRDGRERLWRHARYLPGDPVQIGRAEAEWAIDQYGYRRIGETFASWQELATRVDELTPKVSVVADDLPISRSLAQALLPVLREKAATPAEATTVPRVVARLLREPRVNDDAELREQLLHILEGLTPAPPTAPVSLPSTRMRTLISFYD